MENSIFYISDIHFGHESILRFDHCEDFFPTIKDRDKCIIQNWNHRVKDNDTVIIAGDVSWYNQEETKDILSSLKGNKIIIKGNHDKTWIDNFVQQPSTKVIKTCDYLKMKDNGRRVVICHYPILFWDGQHNGAYHVYGHVHESREELLFQQAGKEILDYLPDLFEFRAMNAGASINNFFPRTLDELIITYNLSSSS